MTRKSKDETKKKQTAAGGEKKGAESPFPREMAEMMAGCCGPMMAKKMAACMSRTAPAGEETKQAQD